MSAKKFEALVNDMIHWAPIDPKQYDMAKRIGFLMKMIYSEAVSAPKIQPEPKRFFSRIAGKNLGQRIRPKKSRF